MQEEQISFKFQSLTMLKQICHSGFAKPLDCLRASRWFSRLQVQDDWSTLNTLGNKTRVEVQTRLQVQTRVKVQTRLQVYKQSRVKKQLMSSSRVCIQSRVFLLKVSRVFHSSCTQSLGNRLESAHLSANSRKVQRNRCCSSLHIKKVKSNKQKKII